MFSLLTHWTRSGVIALAALATVPISAPAAPIGPTVTPAVADGTLAPTLVQGEGRDRSASPAYRKWPRFQGQKMRDRDARQVRRNDRRSFRRDFRRPNRHYRRDRDFWGPGIVLNFSAPAYRYRPAYRARYSGSAHVEWCYARYRSYRAWDNTYQPYNGRRRQCISPYS